MKNKLLLTGILLTKTISPFDNIDPISLATGTALGASLVALSYQNTLTFNPFKKKKKQEVPSEKKEEKSNFETLFVDCYYTTYYKPGTIQTKFHNIAGYADVKKTFSTIGKQLHSNSLITTQLPTSILLAGPSGVGKTLFAYALAGETKYTLIKTSCHNLANVLRKDTINNFVQKIKKEAPCILLIDDIDSVSSEFNFLLQELNNEIAINQNKEKPIFIVATTSNRFVTESSCFSKFNHILTLMPPNIKERNAIIQMYLANTAHDPEIDSKKIARLTYSFTGLELKNLLNKAAIIALEKNQNIFTMSDVYQARDEMMFGNFSKSMLLCKENLKITAYHEAGHALVQLLISSNCLYLDCVTILPREHALGFCSYRHSDVDNEKFTVQDCLQRIDTCLGGRAAEELVFNCISTGPRSDFVQATEMAHRMICNFGMTDILGKQVKPYGLYGPKTLEKIDQAITELLDQEYEKVLALLQNNRDKLDLLATTLLEKETIYADEIYDLLGLQPPKEAQYL